MSAFLHSVKLSAESLKNIRVITGTALFCALYMVLSMFNVYFTPTLRITFGFLAVAASCYFYGMVPNVIAAFICDFLGWMLHPDGAYFPGYAINAMIQAVIYSAFFYQMKELKVWKVLSARLLVVVINFLILNPLWLSIMYGDSFWVLASARVVKNIIMFPIDCLMLYLVLQMCIRIGRQIKSGPTGIQRS